jgi:hypothetical protein
MLWANGPVAEDVKEGHVWLHEHPFNVGQHIAHNAMLDECVRLNVTLHIRVDDDCFMTTAKWLTRLLAAWSGFRARGWERVTMGIDIQGLRNPPPSTRLLEFTGVGKKKMIDQVEILGGIFRATPMGLMRYFRWDERLPMGMGEARQFANYCKEMNVDMLRVRDITATHGESTDRQETDTAWAAEHHRLQYIPFGL